MSFNYQTTHTVTGHTSGNNVDINFTFDYLDEDDVKVYKTDTSGTALVLGTNWQFQNKKRVRILNGTANVGTIADDDVFIIQRQTNVDDAYINYAPGSAIRAEDLNNNQLQALYSAQEREERSVPSTGGTVTGDVNINAASILFAGTNTGNNFETTVTAAEPSADRTITIPNITGTLVTTGDTGTVATGMIANDAINADKIADDVINSEHYAAGSIDLEHMSANSVDSDQYVDGSIDRVHLAADIVDGTKIADNSINSEHYVDGSIDRVHLAADIVDGTKIADDSIDSEHYVDGSIDTAHIADGAVSQNKIATGAVNQDKINSSAVGEDELINSAVTANKIAANAVTTAKIEDNAVTTAKIADAELTELATMGSATAAALADLTGPEVQTLDGLLVTTNELNSALDGIQATASELNTLDGVNATLTSAELNILDGVTATKDEINTLDGVSSTLTAADLNQLDSNTLSNNITDWTGTTTFPSSAQVDARITARIDPIGGFEAIANEDSFPATMPPEGTVVSIANAGGMVIGSSATTTDAARTGGGEVTIQNIPTNMQSQTIQAGLGMLVVATSTQHTYDFHRVVATNADVVQLSSDIDDFKARYRVGSSNPTSNNDDGDLFYNTGSDKLLVWDGSSWDEVQSIGEYFIIPDSELNPFTGNGGTTLASTTTISNAPANASQIILAINNVIQQPNSGTSAPTTGFALDGSTIRLAATPAANSSAWGVIIGSTVNIGAPSADTVDGTKIVDDAVDQEHIADNAVRTVHIQDDQVTAAKLADSTSTDADRAVTRNHIRNDAIDGTKIADDAIDSEHYTDGSIDTAHIADNQITTAKLAANSVTAAEILNGEVTHVKLANDAVDGDNIADDSINSEHYVDGSIDTAHIADNQITTAKLAANSVTAAEILNGEVTSAKLAAGAADVVNDTTPQLGGNLDVNGNQIVSASNGDISLQPNGTGTVEVKRASSALNTLTDAATIAVDLSLANNHTVTLGGNRTLGNPTNAEPGQTGSIFIVQDGTGSRTLTPAANWHFAKGGAHPTFSTAANAVDRIDYIVRTSTSIHCVATFNYS